MKVLTKDQILSAPDIQLELVEVPEWKGSVYVKTMTAAERDNFEKSIMGRRGIEPNLEGVRAKMLVATVVDKDGNALFTMEEIDVLGAKSARAVDRLFAVAQRLSGFTPQDVEALAKKSRPGRGGGSRSV